MRTHVHGRARTRVHGREHVPERAGAHARSRFLPWSTGPRVHRSQPRAAGAPWWARARARGPAARRAGLSAEAGCSGPGENGPEGFGRGSDRAAGSGPHSLPPGRSPSVPPVGARAPGSGGSLAHSVSPHAGASQGSPSAGWAPWVGGSKEDPRPHPGAPLGGSTSPMRTSGLSPHTRSPSAAQHPRGHWPVRSVSQLRDGDVGVTGLDACGVQGGPGFPA